MRCAINILVFLLNGMIFPNILTGQGIQKFYQLTDNGTFEYTYLNHADLPVNVFLPVTERTFFLETKRNGVIPSNMSYRSFLELNVAEKQSLIKNGQLEIIAALQRQKNKLAELPSNTTDQARDSEMVNDQKISDYQKESKSKHPDLPWTVRAVTNPGTEYVKPEPMKTGNDDLTATPWIVKNIVQPEEWIASANHGATEPVKQAAREKEGRKSHRYLEPETYYAEVTADDGLIYRFLVTPGKSDTPDNGSERAPEFEMASNIAQPPLEKSNRKIRVAQILNELMSYQDEESLKKYGRVHPGMDGKLYGRSDAELDELLSALLNIKEQMLIESKGELTSLYEELATLAFNK